MRTSRFGGLLLAIGGAVGVLAVLGLVVGFEPATMPRAVLNIAVYKLTFAAAAGLLAAGAIVRRYARRGGPNESEPGRDADTDARVAHRTAALAEGAPDSAGVGRVREATPAPPRESH